MSELFTNHPEVMIMALTCLCIALGGLLFLGIMVLVRPRVVYKPPPSTLIPRKSADLSEHAAQSVASWREKLAWYEHNDMGESNRAQSLRRKLAIVDAQQAVDA